MGFENRVAVITGASSGIGRALAKELARQGAKVGVVARRRERLEELCEEIRREGGTAEFAEADVTDRQATVAAIHSLADRLGPVDLLVANAGVSSSNTPEDLNVTGAEKVIRVNLLGVMYAIEAVLPEMVRRGSGHIAGISSLAAYKGLPGSAAYCASKAALNAYLESLRIQLRKNGIAVTTICPGFIKTAMTAKLPRAPFMVEADAAARRIVRALRRKAKVYNFPWPTTRFIKFSYWLPDWLVARAIPDIGEEREEEVPPVAG